MQSRHSLCLVQLYRTVSKASLLSGKVEDAITHFSSASADDFRQAFLFIGTSDLNEVMSQIPVLTSVVIESDTAQYSFDQIVDGVTLTFPVEFVKENGLWKVESF